MDNKPCDFLDADKQMSFLSIVVDDFDVSKKQRKSNKEEKKGCTKKEHKDFHYKKEINTTDTAIKKILDEVETRKDEFKKLIDEHNAYIQNIKKIEAQDEEKSSNYKETQKQIVTEHAIQI